MNQFIFCLVVDSQILFGTLQANDGRHAREILEEKFQGRAFTKLTIKGVASKTYEFDVVSNVSIS